MRDLFEMMTRKSTWRDLWKSVQDEAVDLTKSVDRDARAMGRKAYAAMPEKADMRRMRDQVERNVSDLWPQVVATAAAVAREVSQRSNEVHQRGEDLYAQAERMYDRHGRPFIGRVKRGERKALLAVGGGVLAVGAIAWAVSAMGKQTPDQKSSQPDGDDVQDRKAVRELPRPDAA
jgi:hypothetical protein